MAEEEVGWGWLGWADVTAAKKIPGVWGIFLLLLTNMKGLTYAMVNLFIAVFVARLWS